jgi:hypothetical protein
LAMRARLMTEMVAPALSRRIRQRTAEVASPWRRTQSVRSPPPHSARNGCCGARVGRAVPLPALFDWPEWLSTGGCENRDVPPRCLIRTSGTAARRVGEDGDGRERGRYLRCVGRDACRGGGGAGRCGVGHLLDGRAGGRAGRPAHRGRRCLRLGRRRRAADSERVRRDPLGQAAADAVGWGQPPALPTHPAGSADCLEPGCLGTADGRARPRHGARVGETPASAPRGSREGSLRPG